MDPNENQCDVCRLIISWLGKSMATRVSKLPKGSIRTSSLKVGFVFLSFSLFSMRGTPLGDFKRPLCVLCVMRQMVPNLREHLYEDSVAVDVRGLSSGRCRSTFYFVFGRSKRTFLGDMYIRPQTH